MKIQKNFRKPITYILPAYWASYLINEDASGITPEDKAHADRFMKTRNLPFPVSCSDESWFQKWNDSDNGLAGDVMEFYFVP